MTLIDGLVKEFTILRIGKNVKLHTFKSVRQWRLVMSLIDSLVKEFTILRIGKERKITHFQKVQTVAAGYDFN